MKFLLSVLLLALSCCFVSADILFTRKAAPKGWTLGSRADPAQPMSFLLALKQTNLDALEEKFWAVTDPDSPHYQQYMTKESIMEFIKPIDSDYQTVIDWLQSNGFTRYESYGDAIRVKATAFQCESLFSTIIHQYKNNENGQIVYRQYGSFSVPSHIKERIDAVFGISTFPMPRYIAHKGSTDNPVGVVAQTLYGLYNITHQSAGKDAKLTSQAVIEFQGQNFAPSDLTAYALLTGIPIQAVPANQIIGPNDPTNTGTESTLDIDFIATVNIQASNWFWIEPGNNWLYAFAVHFFNTTVVPQVISISYGWYEGAECDINPEECSMIGVDAHGYVKRVNTEFLKIGLRGISILVASGDSGAHTRTDPDCSAPTLRSEFPAGSPYVTTVGATQLQNTQLLPNQPAACTSAGYSCAASGTEVAVSYAVAMFTSGGGFSEVAAQPSYQKTAVSRYLKSGIPLPPSSYYNATNRGQPDVSAVGNNNLIYQGGSMQAVGGTSAATPIFAAVASLLNEFSLKKSGKTLGFLNPLLYKMWEEAPNTFNDVTSGDNKCTEDGCGATCQGWYATKGWDPVTGLGTPNVGHMLAYLEKQFE